MKFILLFILLTFAYFSYVLCHQSHHGNHDSSKTQMHNNKMAQDFDHIAEHLKEKINLKKELTPEELEFYYFMEHDFNNDSRLDGLEILAAIKHSDLATDLNLETKNLSGADLKEAYHKEINYYADIIDEILKEDDFNNDGYLSYLEYALARSRDERQEIKTNSKSEN